MADLHRPDAKMVASECARRIDALVEWLGLAPRHKTNGCFHPLNPMRADATTGSFVVYGAGHAKQGGWTDFTEPDRLRGDALGLCAYIKSGDPKDYKEGYAVGMRFLGWSGAGALDRPQQQRAREALDADRAEADARAADTLVANRRKAQGIWLQGAPLVAGDPVMRYLEETRGVRMAALPATPNALRLARDVWHAETKRKFTAMRALICAPDGKAWGVHTTFLEERDGGWRKAAFDDPDHPVRKIWPAGFWGGAIRLSKSAHGLTPAEAEKRGVRDVLAIGEGIETGLTVAAIAPEWRVWAAGVGGNIGTCVWPACTRAVVLLAENDADKHAGDAKKAADAHKRWRATLLQCATQAKALGVPLFEARPPTGSKDWNDVLAATRAELDHGA